MIRARRVPVVAVFLAAVALASFAGGWRLARAQYAEDSNWNTYASCYYSGYTFYDTAGGPYAYSETFHSTCASQFYLSAYIWNSAISDFDEVLSGWIDGSSFYLVYYRHTSYPTTNVYGYHQIRKPVWSDSPTIETHAQ